MREMRREPEVVEERVPVVECLDVPARITSEELAPIHSVIQNACSTRPRAVADLGVAMLKKNDLQESVWQPVVKRDKKSRQTWETRCQTWNPSWVGTRTCWTPIIEYTTIGLCLSRHEAAEVYLTEELRHAETNPTCEIHESYCMSH